MKRLTYQDEDGTPHWRQEFLDDDTEWAGELIRSTVANMEDTAEHPHLDRTAWEPCEHCEDYTGKCCLNCLHDVESRRKYPCASCDCISKWEPKENFCSRCGRPLTDAAWDMLERRLARHEQK